MQINAADEKKICDVAYEAFKRVAQMAYVTHTDGRKPFVGFHFEDDTNPVLEIANGIKTVIAQRNATIAAQTQEIKRLRKLNRCEQTIPPNDFVDDQTTEMAVRLAEAQAEIDQWCEKSKNWMASPEAAARLEGYRELAETIESHAAEIERLKAALAFYEKPLFGGVSE
jgi:hypothetical protein